MDKILAPFKQSKHLNTLFLSNVFISFHYALIIYINSSFLSNFYSEGQVSSLYLIGSLLDTILLLNASRILEKIGSYRFTVYCITLELMATIGLLLSTNAFLVAIYFLTHVFTISLLLFNMDVFVESVSTDEAKTGSIRATYLTLTNITIVLAPALVAFLVFGNNYAFVYLLSAVFLLPLYSQIKKFKNVRSLKMKHIYVNQTISEYIKNKDLYNIFISQSLLQFFYGYMVIYMPIYLVRHIGFSWAEVGIMFTIMLVPFVLFEVPIGELEDSKYGEKEFLTIGFVIIGLSTVFMSFITTKIFWMWTLILFISRIGASFVEVSSESYFFRHVNQQKADIISFFRISRPLSFMLAPLITTIVMEFIPAQYVFIVIGFIMVLGCHYAIALKNSS